MGICSTRESDSLCCNSKRKENGSENEINQFMCVICCDENDLSKTKVLQCSHVFHEKCINRWWRYKKNCPICRQ